MIMYIIVQQSNKYVYLFMHVDSHEHRKVMRVCQLKFMKRKTQEERQSCVFVCRRVHGGRWWSGGLEQRGVCVCVCICLSFQSSGPVQRCEVSC